MADNRCRGESTVRTVDALHALKALGDFHYQGDSHAYIEGVTNGAVSGGLNHQYSVLIDEHWRGGAAERLRVDWDTLPERVSRATRNGIAGFLCNDEFATHPALEGHNVFSAPDARELFYRLGGVLRDSRGSSLIAALTGSAGKTTTKRMLAHALQAADRGSRVAAAPRSFNVATEALKNLSRSSRTEYSVVEIAGSAFPEFRRRAFTASADVSIVTSISEAHLVTYGSLEQLVHDKAGIFDCPPAGGTAVINSDTVHANVLVQQAIDQGWQIVTYGEGSDATLRLLSYDDRTGEVTARIAGETLHYVVGARGKHMAMNSLAVIATLRSFRLPGWRAGLEALAAFAALKGRGEVSELMLEDDRSVTLIDESYNANPGSVRAALASLRRTSETRSGRLILVLGDMLELGEASKAIHANLAEPIISANPDAVFLLGEDMWSLQLNLEKTGYTGSKHWTDRGELCDEVQSSLRDGDTILIKSSNGMGLNELVARLQT